MPKEKRNKDFPLYEPYRHEWVSLRLFQAFVADKTDLAWLHALSQITEQQSTECVKDGLALGNFNHPIINLSPFAKLVAWLILTHDKLPLAPSWMEGVDAMPFEYMDDWFIEDFNPQLNSFHCHDLEEFARDNWSFVDDGLPYKSESWRYNARDLALAAISNEHQLSGSDFLFDNLFTSHISRLCLMKL